MRPRWRPGAGRKTLMGDISAMDRPRRQASGFAAAVGFRRDSRARPPSRSAQRSRLRICEPILTMAVGRECRRDRGRTGVARGRRRPAAAWTGHRPDRGLAAGRRAEGRDPGYRTAKGQAERGRGSRSHGDAERRRRSRWRRTPKVAAVQTQAAIERLPKQATPKALEETRPKRTKASAAHRYRQGPAEADRDLGQNDQRISTSTSAIRTARTAEIGHGEGVRAQPDRPCAVGEYREGSGDPAFDEAALAMIRRSDPVPRPPAALDRGRVHPSADFRVRDFSEPDVGARRAHCELHRQK